MLLQFWHCENRIIFISVENAGLKDMVNSEIMHTSAADNGSDDADEKLKVICTYLLDKYFLTLVLLAHCRL